MKELVVLDVWGLELCGSRFSNRKVLCRLFDVASSRAHNFLLLGVHPWRQPVAPDCAGKGRQSVRAAGRKGLGSAGGWLELSSAPHVGLFCLWSAGLA